MIGGDNLDLRARLVVIGVVAALPNPSYNQRSIKEKRDTKCETHVIVFGWVSAQTGIGISATLLLRGDFLPADEDKDARNPDCDL